MDWGLPACIREVAHFHLNHATGHRTTHLYVFTAACRSIVTVRSGLNFTVIGYRIVLNKTSPCRLGSAEAPRFWLERHTHGVCCNRSNHFLVIIFPRRTCSNTSLQDFCFPLRTGRFWGIPRLLSKVYWWYGGQGKRGRCVFIISHLLLFRRSRDVELTSTNASLHDIIYYY
jgi:hypothetical protein